MRLDKYLAHNGLATSRTLAAKLIAAGAVSLNGKPVRKVSLDVTPGDNVQVHRSELTEYVSRAGHKLAGALNAFPQVQVSGKRCLDAGASTGGFTDVLLRAGAAHVAAVDVGHNQLVQQLRDDVRVSVYEGLNVRYLKPADIGGQVDVTVGDLSFISLTLVMRPLAEATAPGGDLLLMVKPQFEVGKHRIGKGGVVVDAQARAEAVQAVQNSARECGLTVCATSPSPLPGQDGNKEYFLWCTKPMR